MVKSFSKSFSKLKGSKDLQKISHEILHNRPVLYFIFVIAVGNLFNFVFTNDLMSVGVFIAAGLLTSFFSKNMVVIMVVAMVVANVVRFSLFGKEGFGGKKEAEPWEKAMEESFNDAMNEAFVDDESEDEDEDDGDDGEDEEEDEDEEEPEKFTTRFEGFKLRTEKETDDRKRERSHDNNKRSKTNQEEIKDLKKRIKALE
jgi:hypothetical protein